MAEKILMRHSASGVTTRGFYGFSWTTFFFGFLPALFRGDFVTFIILFVISIILAITTLGIGVLVFQLAWAFFYNKYYTRKLLERGYVFADSEARNTEASLALGVVPATTPSQRNMQE